MKTCLKCGNIEKEDSSLFCQNCGNYLNQEPNNNSDNSQNNKRVLFQNQKSLSRANKKGLLILSSIGLVFIILASLVVGTFFYQNSTYNKIGEKIYSGTFSPNLQTNVSISITNKLGDITIINSDLGNYSYKITQGVYFTDDKFNATNALPMTILDSNLSSIEILFNSINVNSSYNPNFKYNFLIELNNKLIIRSFSINTLVGNIKVTSYNQSIYYVNLSTTTGNIGASFANCEFGDSLTKVQSNNGNINFDILEPSFLGNRSWELSTTIGDIALVIGMSGTSITEQDFKITTSIGSITLTRTYHPTPLEIIYSQVRTGTINLDSKSTNNGILAINNQKSSPTMIYYYLETITGNITVK